MTISIPAYIGERSKIIVGFGMSSEKLSNSLSQNSWYQSNISFIFISRFLFCNGHSKAFPHKLYIKYLSRVRFWVKFSIQLAAILTILVALREIILLNFKLSHVTPPKCILQPVERPIRATITNIARQR